MRHNANRYLDTDRYLRETYRAERLKDYLVAVATLAIVEMVVIVYVLCVGL